MKITITMKCPDCVSDAIDRAAKDKLENLGITEEEEELGDLMEYAKEDIKDAIKPWVEYEEYITVEIDTDTKTAIVIPVN